MDVELFSIKGDLLLKNLEPNLVPRQAVTPSDCLKKRDSQLFASARTQRRCALS